MEIREAPPKIHVDREEAKEQVVRGAARAIGFIRKVVAGRRIQGKRYGYDEALVMRIHDLLYYQSPNTTGRMLRQTNSTTVGGRPVGRFEELSHKFYLFGRWFEREMATLAENPEDLIGALAVAAGAHYGIVAHDTHFFDNGNGRTARALVNAILMSQSYELTMYGLAIPPVPILRLSSGDDRYIRALRNVDATGELNPFMTYLASRWAENLESRLERIRAEIPTPKVEGDRLLIKKLEGRLSRLHAFIASDEKAYRAFPIPAYFHSVYSGTPFV